ncbi:hypothetical protein C9374_011810 [Naegleria lovaniensis]|uniref:Uncharacterized protein n=1 Tax=Naegleria lovaniensis TaxID=51637 RepID=A0AA88GC34_NAELO|nr:uncharacterized protein C9374_011810 [Naegleria lovaniensis]KAG2373721.1 hypothetical protein C9374_011810 [Naegleria lovaniensis]
MMDNNSSSDDDLVQQKLPKTIQKAANSKLSSPLHTNGVSVNAKPGNQTSTQQRSTLTIRRKTNSSLVKPLTSEPVESNKPCLPTVIEISDSSCDESNNMNTDDDDNVSLELKYILIENSDSSEDEEEMYLEHSQQPTKHETSFNLIDLNESRENKRKATCMNNSDADLKSDTTDDEKVSCTPVRKRLKRRPSRAVSPQQMNRLNNTASSSSSATSQKVVAKVPTSKANTSAPKKTLSSKKKEPELSEDSEEEIEFDQESSSEEEQDEEYNEPVDDDEIEDYSSSEEVIDEISETSDEEMEDIRSSKRKQKTTKNNQIKVTKPAYEKKVVAPTSSSVSKKNQPSRKPSTLQDLNKLENGWSFDVKNNQYVLELDGNPFGFIVSAKIYEGLYHHQQIGVKWLTERHFDSNFNGGILGDKMGLGKTVQISSFIHGLFLSKKAKRVVVLCPNSVIGNWKRELEKWSDDTIQDVVVFHNVGSNKVQNKKRISMVEQFNRAANNGGAVLLSTLQTISNHMDFLKKEFVDDKLIDSVIIDEAHKIKNSKSKCHIQIAQLPSKSRFALTGTPIMNRLNELYALFSWMFEDKLLGTQKDFNETYAIAINRSTKRDARLFEKQLGNIRADCLREKIKPYLLMREKSETLKVDNQLFKTDGKSANTSSRIGQKNDLVLWITLTEEQKQMYKDYISSEEVKRVLNRTQNPLVGITVMKQICDHHIMCRGYNEMQKHKEQALKQAAKEQAMEEDQLNAEDMKDFIEESDDDQDAIMGADYGILDADELDEKTKKAIERRLKKAEEARILKYIRDEPVDDLISASCKVKIVQELILKNREDGHRLLIFSSFTRMLDIIAILLKSLDLKFNRIDGSVTSYKERTRLVDEFNTDEDIDCFLLTTQAGGVGLNLVGASRVIIIEPNWNPQLDEQAIDRVYRIGQRQNVIVYRLITAGTIEEYIYGKQIAKNTISRTATVESNQYRYFGEADLQEMFTLKDTTISKTCKRLNNIHKDERKDAPGLADHIKFLEDLDGLIGISDHDVLFQKEADDVDEDLALQEELKRQHQQAQIRKAREEYIQRLLAARENLPVASSVQDKVSSFGSQNSQSIAVPTSSSDSTSSQSRDNNREDLTVLAKRLQLQLERALMQKDQSQRQQKWI